MPNWVKNELRLYGDLNTINELLAKCKSKESNFDFNGLIPTPKNIEVDINWYRIHWGTKCNACDAVVEAPNPHTDPSYTTICFDTAWNAPIPVFRAIHEQYPSIEIYAYYADEDIGNNCGVYHNGDLDTCEEDDERTRIEFACDIWGLDPDEYLEDRYA